MKIALRILICCLLLCGHLATMGQTFTLGVPFSRYFSSQDYKGGIQNWKITQSNNGLVYVANNFGLLEFDGASWSRHVVPKATKLRDVFVDSQGRIFVACQGDFGYFISNNIRLDYVSLADSLPDQYRNFDETWSIFEQNESLIFCTFNQIFIYSKAGHLKHVVDPRYAPENVFLANNKIFVNQLETGLSVLEGDSLKLLPYGEFFTGMTITSVIPLSYDRLWIATLNHGIFISHENGFIPWAETHTSFFAHAGINEAIRLQNGNIAVGTQNEGLIVFDLQGRIQLHLNKGSGMNSRTVISLFEDIQGNLWVGHNNGITLIELSLPFSHISEQSGLPGTGYSAYVHSQDLYLGTNNGLYITNAHDPIAGFELVSHTEGQVYSVARVANTLLLGHHLGAFEIRGNQALHLSQTLGAWTFLELSDHPGYIIEGNYKGLLLFKKERGKVQFVRKIKGFNESSRVMKQDEQGNIWMAHGYKGVFKLKLNEALDSVEVKFYGTESGLPSNLLINVWHINSRIIFTTEGTIYRHNAETDRFEVDPFFSKFFDSTTRIVSMAEDPLGNIYYIAVDEIGLLKKQIGGGYVKETNIFNRLHLLLNDDLQNISVMEANHVLFGAKEGFISYRLSDPEITRQPFQTLIRRVMTTSPVDSLISNGRYLVAGKNVFVQPEEQIPSLRYKRNSLRIEYSATFIDSQHRTEYQCWLENVEPGYGEWTTKTDKEYTNLPEGEYTFHVRARNLYGQISEDSIYSFEVLPPWHRTRTAFTVYSLLLVGLLVTVFYLIDKKYKKEKHKLTERQRQELKRIDTELRTSEEELEKLRNEKLQAEIKSKNKELATSTMHLINKNSFINSVKNNLFSISKRSKNQEVKNEIGKIIHNIDKNISEDDDWKHFEIHFDEVHGDFISRLKEDFPGLSPQETRLSAYLRMNLSTKEIAHLLNISVRGVEIARYRLRKKMELEREVNLQEFILRY